MAKPVRFTPKKSKHGWRLNIPAKFSETGKRQQLFYRTQSLALAAADAMKGKREDFGNQARAIAPSLAEQATAAATLLEPLGISLLDAVRRFVETETRTRDSVPIEEALKRFRATGGSWSVSQSNAYRQRCEKLIEAFAGKTIATIEGEELRQHLEATTGSASSFNHAFRLVRAIWRWCAKPPRKWCDVEVVAHLELKQTVAPGIGILTSKEARAVMVAAETYFPDCVPAFAIALLTGLRQQEIDRLQSEDVTAEGINLPATSAKTKRRRFIQMPPPLAAWLAVYPIGDSVTPSDWQRKQRAVRRLAGFAVWSDLVAKLDLDPPQEAAPPRGLPGWPSNALRHTAASMSLALGRPIEQLVFEHGHSGGLQMLKRHYIGTMTKAEAVKIWSIGPQGSEIQGLEVVA